MFGIVTQMSRESNHPMKVPGVINGLIINIETLKLKSGAARTCS